MAICRARAIFFVLDLDDKSSILTSNFVDTSRFIWGMVSGFLCCSLIKSFMILLATTMSISESNKLA